MMEMTSLTGCSCVYFGIVKYPAGGHLGPRIQRGIEFVYLISGSVEIEVDGRVSLLKPGKMALMLPGRQEIYRFHAEQESEHSWCQLDFDEMPDDLLKSLAKVSSQLPVNPEIEQLMELGLAVTNATHIDNHLVLGKLGEALLQYYLAMEAVPENERPTVIPRHVRQACRFISEHYAEPLSLENMAQHAHCSVNHLINQFRLCFGLTPMKYLWRLRLERAEALLRHTELPIAVIAEQCGFTSQFHFSRLFKERQAISPSYFRKQYR